MSDQQTIDWLRGLAAKGGRGVVNNIDARSLGRIADDLMLMQRRITVLEMVITEEVDVYCCRDEANAMIVKDLMNRFRAVVPTREAPHE